MVAVINMARVFAPRSCTSCGARGVSADEWLVLASRTGVRSTRIAGARGLRRARAGARRARRPAHVFRLTAKAEELFPKRYDLFAKAVLRQIGEVWGERGLNTILCGCAGEMVGGLRPQLERLGFDARVLRLTELLGEMGYEAEAERLADGSYLLTEWNCPQPELAREYRQLCDQELIVYRELLETEVTRESRIAGGASWCSYRVMRPKKA